MCLGASTTEIKWNAIVSLIQLLFMFLHWVIEPHHAMPIFNWNWLNGCHGCFYFWRKLCLKMFNCMFVCLAVCRDSQFPHHFRAYHHLNTMCRAQSVFWMIGEAFCFPLITDIIKVNGKSTGAIVCVIVICDWISWNRNGAMKKRQRQSNLCGVVRFAHKNYSPSERYISHGQVANSK